jgi:hypothetical protein
VDAFATHEMVKSIGVVNMDKLITAIQWLFGVIKAKRLWLYNKKIKEIKRKQHAAIRQLGVTTISK